MRKVPANGAREDKSFQVATLLDKIRQLVALSDAVYILFDDGAFVELCSDVVTGCADEFDAARERRMIGLCAGEGGQKGMVDIDYFERARFHEVWRENLHVACEDDQVNVIRCEQIQMLLLDKLFRRGCNRREVEGDAIKLCERASGLVIAYDERKFAG